MLRPERGRDVVHFSIAMSTGAGLSLVRSTGVGIKKNCTAFTVEEEATLRTHYECQVVNA